MAGGLAQAVGELELETRGAGFTDITGRVADWLAEVRAVEGLLTVFIRHTSASLSIQENADPDVQADFIDALARLAPEDAPYRHSSEGADDMPAHIKAALTATSLAIPVRGGRMTLGTWQGVYVIEHRRRAHRRSLTLHFLGSRRK